VHSPPGIAGAGAQLEPTEHSESPAQASPTVLSEAVLQAPVSQTRPGPHCASDVHRPGALSSEHAHTPRAAIAAATVRNRTLPPGARVRAVSQDTL